MTLDTVERNRRFPSRPESASNVRQGYRSTAVRDDAGTVRKHITNGAGTPFPPVPGSLHPMLHDHVVVEVG